MVEQERLARELELAAEIQRGMLPANLPEDFPVKGINHPARQVSGDFYDILQRPDGRIVFAIGGRLRQGHQRLLADDQDQQPVPLSGQDHAESRAVAGGPSTPIVRGPPPPAACS